MARAVSSKALRHLKKSLEAEHIFSGLTERVVLRNLLEKPQNVHAFPLLEAWNELQAPRTRTTSANTGPLKQKVALEINVTLPKPSKQATELMQRPAVSSKDLDTFLHDVHLTSVPQTERAESIDRGVIDLASASTPNNLRTLMQYLAKYWQVGLGGTRPTIFQARRQAKLVLVRAVDVHPATQYEGGGEQVGLPDFWRFEQFVNNFFNYMDVKRPVSDELDDMLLRLCAKAGPLNLTSSQILGRTYVDEKTLQIYLDAVQHSTPSAEALMPMKSLLLNEHTGTAVARFLLRYVQTSDDLAYVLATVDASSSKLDVYNECQAEIVASVVRSEQHPTTRLAKMFGMLHRIQAVVELSPSTLDVALQTALAAESKPAVRNLLQAVKHESQQESSVVSQARKYVHIE